jgi:hypothetical protein
VAADTLDCGALAALATAAMRERGLTCYPAQLIQQYTEGSGCHWRERWALAAVKADWIRGDLVYHEGSAVVLDHNELRIWDATAAAWLNPTCVSGYGGVLALRIESGEQADDFQWGTHRIAAARWQVLAPELTVRAVEKSAA